MKCLIGILFSLITCLSFSQDAIVIKSDTINCKIVSIEARGVVFEYDGSTRVASLDIARAVFFNGTWMQNASLRSAAATTIDEPLVEAVMKAKYNENTPAYHIYTAGTSLKASVIVMVFTSVAVIALSRYPDVAKITGAVGMIFSLGAIIYSGDQLQKAAARINSL